MSTIPQGFKQLTDFTAPFKLTSDALLHLTAEGETEAKTYKVLLLRKKGAVVAALDQPEGSKVVKVTLPFNVVDAEVAKTVTVFVPEAYEPPAAAAPAEPVTKEPKPESKISKCRAIYAAMPGAAKADVVKRFIEEAGCTKMGANTYYITCSKA